MRKNFMVSVFMLTYNQERLISKAIDGVISQKTNFKFQLVISEDASNDNTLKICKQFQAIYPDKINLIENQQNIGLIANYMKTAKELTGKYIAICDGDDYWIDEHKLQKQVDFLENQPDYAIVYCKCKKLYPEGRFKVPKGSKAQKKDKDFSDLVMRNFIPSVTVLFRNKIKDEPLPLWINSLPYGDWPTYLWTVKDGGKIHFMDEIMAVYRMQVGESFKLMEKLSNAVKVELEILDYLSNDFHYGKWRQCINQSIRNKKKSLMLCYNREGNYLEAFKLYFYLLSIKSFVKLSKLYIYSLQKNIKSNHLKILQ